MRIDVKRQLFARSERVKGIDFHPQEPWILTTLYSGHVYIWSYETQQIVKTFELTDVPKGKQGVAVGFDDGLVVVKLGREEPAVSMDASGKLIWARHNEVVSSIIKGGDASVKDNTPISLPTKDLGSCEVYPQTLLHSPNGRFVAVCGDGEYIIYTALAWRNKAFGSALDFVWGAKENSNDFAIRESATSVKVYKNFTEKTGGLDVGFQAEGLSGGVLLGVKGQGGVSFFDWASGGLVRRIEVEPRQVYWSDSGELVTLACEDSFYVLRFSREAYNEALQNGEADEDGVEAAFEVITDINESVRTGEWVGDCFIYTNSTNRLNYLVGDQTYTVSHFDQPMYILGYIQRDSRIYLADKDVGVTSFALSLPVLEYQTLVLRGDMDTAEELLSSVPQDQLNKIARFLEGQGHKELALEVATDSEHKFELALGLNQLDIALELAREADVEHKWKTVGDAALTAWDVALAQECFTHAKDLGSLLLLYSSTADREGLTKLAEQAEAAGAHNVAFSAQWLAGNVEGCVETLVRTGRISEAVLFSQTYKPSLTTGVVAQWKESLDKSKKGRVSKLLGVPTEDEELFPEWDEWLRLEREGGAETAAPVAKTNGNGAESGADAASEDDDEAAEEEADASASE
ncbi:hypothetical protein BN1723_004831 [Verticillium longisporum]|uniref:Beta'-coat protein n=1 Tax=Verticillium longisporum TaxID=100787 RepID=A0A0G4N2I7_VERLO|nr:hypothetical protein BN1723_004831 [Verticillium longisporum]